MKRHLLAFIALLTTMLGVRADDYQLVTSAADINTTDTYILATLYQGKIYALSGFGSKLASATSVASDVTTLPQSLMSVNAEIKQFQFQEVDDYKAIYCVTDNLYIGGGSGTELLMDASVASGSYKFTIENYGSNPGYYKFASVTGAGASTKRVLLFYLGGTFKNYAQSNMSGNSDYSNVAIYRLAEADTRTPVSLTVSGAPESLNVGETATLSCISTPAVNDITWSSSKPDVATVSADGVVTAIASGETVITARFAGDATYQPASQDVTLKVVKPIEGNAFQITFKVGTSSNSTIQTKTESTTYISEGAAYVASVKAASQAYYDSPGGLRLASSNNAGNLTLSLAESYRISAITVSAKRYTANESGVTLTVNGSKENITTNNFSDYEFTFADPVETAEISFATTAKKRVYIEGITIYYQEGDADDYVEAPQFSVAGGEVKSGTAVELTCGTEGASIYYTTDNTTPTTLSTLYNGTPITITATTTVKAIAVKEGMLDSGVNSATYTVLPSYPTIAAFEAAAPASAAILDCPVTVTYCNGRYLYVKDAAGTQTLIYLPAAGTFNNGDQLPAGITGKWNGRYNEIQVDDAAGVGTPIAGTPVDPVVVESIEKDMYNQYVKIENVAISGLTATLPGGSTVALYNRFGLASVPEGDGMAIVGIVNINNTTSSQTGTQGTLQLLPTEVIEPAPTKVADLTITPAFGDVYQNVEVVISCETDGALLYGTIGSTTLDGEELPYTYIVTEDVGSDIDVDVTAKKQPLTDSESLTGTFTVQARPTVIPGIEATFNWNDPTSLTSNIELEIPTETGKGMNLPISSSDSEGTTFTSGNLVMKFGGKPSNNNLPRIWYYKGSNGAEYQLRVYTGTQITFYMKSELGTIDQIEFTYSTGSISLLAGQPGELKNKVWTPSVARADSEGVREVTFTVGSNVYLTKTAASYTDIPSGISVVETAVEAPALYYNLQGMRVEHPAQGNIYIRVRGTQVDKIRF